MRPQYCRVIVTVGVISGARWKGERLCLDSRILKLVAGQWYNFLKMTGSKLRP